VHGPSELSQRSFSVIIRIAHDEFTREDTAMSMSVLNRFRHAGLPAIVVLVMAAVCALTAPSPLRSAHAQPAGSCDTASDPNVALEVSVGRPVVIAMDANRTTGYTWYMSQPPDPSVVQLFDATYQTPPPGSPPGRGSLKCWSFLAFGEGTTEVSFDYRRPFELDQPPANSLTYTIVVDPAQ
jgi:predicted secreted protein